MELLIPYRKAFEQALSEQAALWGEGVLANACRLALSQGGKRMRPILLLLVADCLGHKQDVMPAALAVEYFHTASLIADDLPCMDNEQERRGAQTLHVRFNEATALLASYSLIAAGYGAVGQNGEKFQDPERITQALACVARTTGIHGAAGGQFLDLYPPENSWAIYEKTVLEKTASLFELSFVLGWLFGGGELTLVEKVKEAAIDYGMAFQIFDDLEDVEKDRSLGRQMNIVCLLGEEGAKKQLNDRLMRFESLAKSLHLWSDTFATLCKKLSI